MQLVNARCQALIIVLVLFSGACADQAPGTSASDTAGLDMTDTVVPSDVRERDTNRDTGQPATDLADDDAVVPDSGAPDLATDIIEVTEAGSEDAGSDTGVVEDTSVTEDGGSDTGSDVADSAVDLADEEDICAEITAVADEVSLPADIIWIIDSSESMNGEIEMVRENINEFTRIIGASGIDYRVIMVASDRDYTEWFLIFPLRSYWGVCVPPPLSAADRCPDVDNPDRYLHVREHVYSEDSLEILIGSYGDYRGFLRPSAKLHIVEVSDDESVRDASWFWNQVRALPPPGFGEDFKFHSLVQNPGDSCGDGDGDTYISLSDTTGGLVLSICEDDWDPIFEVLQEEVIEGSAIPCHYELPDVGEYLVVDLEEVNVYYTPEGGEPEILTFVESVDDCGDSRSWHYDDPSAPTGITLCPAACGSGILGQIEVAFGCDTVKH